MAKSCAIWLVTLSLGIAVLGCEPAVQAPGVDGGDELVEGDAQELDPVAAAKNADKEVTDDLLADKATYAEAKEWLSPKHENHALWKGNREAIATFVDDLYEAGAVKVYAVQIGKEGPVEVVAMFVAELPQEAGARTKVIQTHNAFWKKNLERTDDDVLSDFLVDDHGQKYLVLNFDL